MTRKIIIYVISALILAVGVTHIWTFMVPVFDPTQPKIFDVTRIIMGILFLLAGWKLFRFNEGGRELTYWLLYLGLAWHTIILALTLPPDSDFGVSIDFLGKPILNSKDDYMFAIIFLTVSLAINLLIITFLSQAETKKIFIPEAVDHVEST
jgi:hypothetical protein